MKYGTYILNSPDYVSRNDLAVFPVWAEWYGQEEIPYLQSICSSEDEFEKVIIAPYREGRETYYPVLVERVLPAIEFLFVTVDVKVAKYHDAKGYVSIVGNEVVALTIWLEEKGLSEELSLYRKDRVIAAEENPEAISLIQKELGVTALPQLYYSSLYTLSTGENVEGVFEWM